MKRKIDRYITPEAQGILRKEIQEAHGNEVFFIGITDENKRVMEVRPLARGTRSAVAAAIGTGRDRAELVHSGNMVIHNHPGHTLSPSDEDVDLSSFFSTLNVGSLIIDNDVRHVYVLVEPYEKIERTVINDADIEHIFSAGGAIHKHLSSFELRSEQVQMARHVNTCFNQKTIYLIEAGTGTGKTFAYLVPAILHATTNNERVVISTNTINLQEQLIHKDIPFLQQALGIDFRATLVKGRANYVCKRKLDWEQEHLQLFHDDEEWQLLQELSKWALQSRDGSLSDLNFIPQTNVWERICAESESCLRLKCSYYKECFFYKARREAATAHILVINHHVLFADLSIRGAAGELSDYVLLPPFQAVIIDEAHNIEEAATSYFSRHLSRFTIQKILRRLFQQRRRKKPTGLLLYIEHKLRKSEHNVRAHIDMLKQRIIEKTQRCDQIFAAFTEFFDIVATEQRQAKGFITITTETLHSLEYKDFVHDHLLALKFLLAEILEEVRTLITEIEKCAYKAKEKKEGDVANLHAIGLKITDLITITQSFLTIESDNNVRWIECREQKKGTLEVFFNIAPIEVKQVLRQTLYKSSRTILLTSATLAVEGTVSFMKDRLGLTVTDAEEDFTSSELLLPSSFDYQRQVFLGIFENMPLPTEPDFAETLIEVVFKALILTGGKAFVLFTAYSLLNRVADALRQPLELAGFTVLKQGEDNRHTLLRRFKADITSVLFATDSFWEGVDVEGKSLSNVLITRLPFHVPDDPVIQARSLKLKAEGGNPFLDYFVPRAVIRFKQGFGRLIRHRNDYGAVLIFDARVIHKNYGIKFLNSLPKCTMVCGTEAVVLNSLKNFYEVYQPV